MFFIFYLILILLRYVPTAVIIEILYSLKFFVTAKCRIFVTMSDFPCIITLHFTINYRLCSEQKIPGPEKFLHFRKINGLILDRTFDVLKITVHKCSIQIKPLILKEGVVGLISDFRKFLYMIIRA